MTLPNQPPMGDPQTTPVPGMTPDPSVPPTAGQQPQEPTPQPTQGDMFPREYVEQLRHEAAERRQQNKDLKAQLDQLQAMLQKTLGVDPAAPSDQVQATLGQVADLQKKFEQAQTKQRDSELRAVVIAEAAKVGVADPMDAVRLADLTKIEFKDDGTIIGVDEAVKALVEAKPYLLRQQTPHARPGNPGPTNPAGGAPQGPPQWAVDMFRPGMGASIGDGGVAYKGTE